MWFLQAGLGGTQGSSVGCVSVLRGSAMDTCTRHNPRRHWVLRVPHVQPASAAGQWPLGTSVRLCRVPAGKGPEPSAPAGQGCFHSGGNPGPCPQLVASVSVVDTHTPAFPKTLCQWSRKLSSRRSPHPSQVPLTVPTLA